MGAKRIQVSIDSGTTKITLPGNTGELKADGNTLDDTIFGQPFSSTQTGLITWTVTANALYKGYAGYAVTIKAVGTTTAFTTEAMSLVSGKTYKITNPVKNVWDRATAPTFFDGGTPISAANILNIDFLFGQVTFVSGYTPGGAVTATGHYFPTAAIGCTNSYTLTQKSATTDVTCITDAQSNGGNSEFAYALKSVSLELKGIYRSADAFLASVQAAAEVIIEVNPDGAGLSLCRGFFKPTSTDFSGKVGDVEASDITYMLSVPDQSNLLTPFEWIHNSGTKLNLGIQNLLTAWENSILPIVYYLPDGTNGYSGTAVVTDVSLSGGTTAMNEFTADFQGSGALASYP